MVGRLHFHICIWKKISRSHPQDIKTSWEEMSVEKLVSQPEISVIFFRESFNIQDRFGNTPPPIRRSICSTHTEIPQWRISDICVTHCFSSLTLAYFPQQSRFQRLFYDICQLWSQVPSLYQKLKVYWQKPIENTMDLWSYYNQSDYQRWLLLPGTEWDCPSPVLSRFNTDYLGRHVSCERCWCNIALLSLREASSSHALFHLVSFFFLPWKISYWITLFWSVPNLF